MRNFFQHESAMGIAERLKRARTAKYGSARDAAGALGVPQSTYYGHENGSRTPSRDDVARYAKFFGVTQAWLEYGSDEEGPSPAPALRPVNVIGETQAGLWREQDACVDEIPAPVPAIQGRYSGYEQFAYRVRGSSMTGERIFDGDYVVCVPYFDARPRITSGDIAVIERRRNGEVETTLKKIEAHKGHYELRPNSHDARHREPIVIVHDHHVDDGTEVEVKGLVIGVFSPRY